MVRRCSSFKCLSGKTAVITGANSGLGYQTALHLASRGCRVILACRNAAKAQEAREKIVQETGNENVCVKILDLATMQSVRKFAEEVIETEERLDLLINNAGVVDCPDQMTADNLQLGMATNYFAHFLLTYLLLDLLRKSAPSRIINLSSSLAKRMSELKIDELNKFDGPWTLYIKAKLCNILFTKELAKRLTNTGVTTFSLHPGVVHTEAQKFSRVLNFVASKFFLSPEDGVQTTLHVSLAANLEELSGRHFEDCQVVADYKGARDDQKAKELWEKTESLLGLKPNPEHTL